MTETSEPLPPDYRRELYGTALILLVGSAALLWIAGRSWLTVRVDRQPPFGPLSLGVTGRHVYPAITGLAVVGVLAAVLAVVTGRWARRVLGFLVLVVAGTAGTFVVNFLASDSVLRRNLIGDRAGADARLQTVTRHPGWAGAGLVCLVLMLLAGGLLIGRSGRWPGGLSRRYAAPVEAAAAPDPWRQLDRGEDPTIGNG